MRRFLALLLACGLTALTGCAYLASQEQTNPYVLYFAVADLEKAEGGDALATEPARAEIPSDTEAAAAELLRELLSGPRSDALRTPIPAATQLLSCTLDGQKAVVDLSSSYGALSGMELTIADYCITMTLSQLPEISLVSITVRGRELAYRDKQSFLADDVLLTSAEDVVGTAEASLYFLDGNGSLVPERRMMDLYEGDTQISVLLEVLEAGPDNGKLVSALPRGFTILSAWQERDTCYVNLPSAALPDLTDQAALEKALRATALSLCSLDTVEQVQYLVDGEPAAEYGGVSVSAPLHIS